MNYDKDYFIRKFEAIPDEQWCANADENDQGQRCAYGHCGRREGRENLPEECVALRRLLRGIGLYVAMVNDGRDTYYQQPTPKQRILAALHDLP